MICKPETLPFSQYLYDSRPMTSPVLVLIPRRPDHVDPLDAPTPVPFPLGQLGEQQSTVVLRKQIVEFVKFHLGVNSGRFRDEL